MLTMLFSDDIHKTPVPVATSLTISAKPANLHGQTYHTSITLSLIVQQPSRQFPLNLARIPPNQVIADFGRGSSVESEY